MDSSVQGRMSAKGEEASLTRHEKVSSALGMGHSELVSELLRERLDGGLEGSGRVRNSASFEVELWHPHSPWTRCRPLRRHLCQSPSVVGASPTERGLTVSGRASDTLFRASVDDDRRVFLVYHKRCKGLDTIENSEDWPQWSSSDLWTGDRGSG